MELGRERLLEDNSETSKSVRGEQLTSSQIADPFREISTQQTSNFLANFDTDDHFPLLDSEFEQILNCSIPSGFSTFTTSSVTATTSRCCASPKGEKAVQVAQQHSGQNERPNLLGSSSVD